MIEENIIFMCLNKLESKAICAKKNKKKISREAEKEAAFSATLTFGS